jgi:hypothetical protein
MACRATRSVCKDAMCVCAQRALRLILGTPSTHPHPHASTSTPTKVFHAHAPGAHEDPQRLKPSHSHTDASALSSTEPSAVLQRQRRAAAEAHAAACDRTCHGCMRAGLHGCKREGEPARTAACAAQGAQAAGAAERIGARVEAVRPTDASASPASGLGSWEARGAGGCHCACGELGCAWGPSDYLDRTTSVLGLAALCAMTTVRCACQQAKVKEAAS